MYVAESMTVLEDVELGRGSDLRLLPESGSPYSRIVPIFGETAEKASSESICWVEGSVSITF